MKVENEWCQVKLFISTNSITHVVCCRVYRILIYIISIMTSICICSCCAMLRERRRCECNEYSEFIHPPTDWLFIVAQSFLFLSSFIGHSLAHDRRQKRTVNNKIEHTTSTMRIHSFCICICMYVGHLIVGDFVHRSSSRGEWI